MLVEGYHAAVLGLGVGEQHVATYLDDPACGGVRIWDTCAGKLREAAARHPRATVCANEDDAIAHREVGIVSICSPDEAHHSQAMKVLRREKHLFVEKPLCLNRAEADEIWAETKKCNHVKLATNVILRHSPRFQELRRSIASGSMGEVYSIEGDYNYGRMSKIVAGWRADIPYYSVTLGGGIHMIDLMRWLVADEIEEVTAVGNKIASRGTAFRHPDNVVALLKFKRGAVGKTASNFGCVYPHFHRLSVYGTEASFENGINEALFFSSRDPAVAPRRITTETRPPHKGLLLEDFISALKRGSEPRVGADEVFRSLSVCLAIDESLAGGSGRRVPVYD